MGKKLSVKEMQRIAEERGGKCLSKSYINAKTKLRWRCSEGHEWEATSHNIINTGTWCPYCSKLSKITIKEMQEIAKSRGGKCLSKKYINNTTKLRWRCKEGHIWEGVPNSINRGSWCPYCAGRGKLTIEDKQRIAEERGGKCLSKSYTNAKTKLRWRCREGHEWEATPHNIKNIGTWCPYCVGLAKLTIKEMQEIAKSREGKCLSKKYISAKTKLRWRCKEGHIWESEPTNIKSGRWCPVCGRNKRIKSRSLTIEEMQKIAKDSGGKCLSKKYINAHKKLKWRCKEGHEWEATPNNIKYIGTWCPYCARKR